MVVEVVVVLLEHNIRVDKLEHRTMDKELRKPLVIFCPFDVGFLPGRRR